MAVQRVLLSMLVLLVWTCGPVDSKPCSNGVISSELKEIHNSITSPLSLTDSSVGDSPIFSSVIHNITSSFQKHEQIVLMNHTLDIYLRILENILHHDTLLEKLSEKDKVRSAVVHLKEKIVQLKTQYYDNKDDGKKKKMKDVVTTLDEIQVNDLMSQKKALAEFKEIYNAASVIVCKKCPGSHSS